VYQRIERLSVDIGRSYEKFAVARDAGVIHLGNQRVRGGRLQFDLPRQRRQFLSIVTYGRRQNLQRRLPQLHSIFGAINFADTTGREAFAQNIIADDRAFWQPFS
jgi:hypothetical protein